MTAAFLACKCLATFLLVSAHGGESEGETEKETGGRGKRGGGGEKGSRERRELSGVSSNKDTNLTDQGPSLTTSLKLHYVLKALSPNAATVGIRASTYKLWWGWGTYLCVKKFSSNF